METPIQSLLWTIQSIEGKIEKLKEEIDIQHKTLNRSIAEVAEYEEIIKFYEEAVEKIGR